MENRVLLHDNDCERAVLGTLLSDRNAYNDVHEYISEECFFNSLNRSIYIAIASISQRGDRADIVTIQPELVKMGVKIELYDLAEIIQCHTFDVLQYTLRLKELSKRRKIYNLGLILVNNGSMENEDISDVISDASDTLNNLLCDSQTNVKTSDDFLGEVYQRVTDNINGKMSDSTLTGFQEFDNRGGFKPTNLIIIAGDSSQGKTSLADSIALNVAKSGTPIAVYSMEMTGRQLMTRIAAIESDIPTFVLGDRALTERQLAEFDKAVGRLQHLPMYFDDRSSSNIDTIISSIRSLYLKHHIKGVFIDYLQILSVISKNQNTEFLLAECARRLKNLAKELEIWIVLLSQLSRNTDNPEPNLARLRGSGQVNEAADMTILIYRPEYYSKTYGKVLHYPGSFKNVSTEGTALINVAKNRNGETFQFVCGFDAATTHFYDMDDKPLLAEQVEEEPF